MKQLSRERLEMYAEYGASRGFSGKDLQTMARLLLAGMAQDPVAMRWRWNNPEMWNLGEWWYHEPRHYALLSKSDDRECEYVYAAPPAPVVAEPAIHPDGIPDRIWLNTSGEWPEDGREYEVTWCRDQQHELDTMYVRADAWIPCSERMPDVGDVVLTSENGCVNVGEMNSSGANYRYFTSVISGRELTVSHWHPLPAPPKDKQ